MQVECLYSIHLISFLCPVYFNFQLDFLPFANDLYFLLTNDFNGRRISSNIFLLLLIKSWYNTGCVEASKLCSHVARHWHLFKIIFFPRKYIHSLAFSRLKKILYNWWLYHIRYTPNYVFFRRKSDCLFYAKSCENYIYIFYIIHSLN